MRNASAREQHSVKTDFANKVISKKLLNAFLRYLSKDPKNYFLKLLSLAQKITLESEKKEALQKLINLYEEDPVIKRYIERLFAEIDSDYLKRIGYNMLINHYIVGVAQQKKLGQELGFNVPNTILIDPTSACNLRCTGCRADEYELDALEPELLDAILVEAKELGISFIVMSGGEPFLYPYIFDIVEKHDDMTFMIYTNGTKIDDYVADKIFTAQNIALCFSLEGNRERTDARRGKGVFDKVMAAMDKLHDRGVPFGVSLTLMRENVDEVTSDEFVDFLIDKGVLFGWTFHYFPVGSAPDYDLMITLEQRAYLAQRIPYIRRHKPIMIADFWNDGELTLGCIAGGRKYFHINAKGDVEPCAFVHYTMDNIRNKSLKHVLASPLFRAYQSRQPFSDNHLRPCPIIDVPQALRDIVEESGAVPSHKGAETVLSGDIAAFLDERSKAWAETAASINGKRRDSEAVCFNMGEENGYA